MAITVRFPNFVFVLQLFEETDRICETTKSVQDLF